MKFIAFDVETTGLLPGVNRIIELGAIRFSNGQPEAVFSTLVDPQMEIPEEASRINGISNEMVAGKPLIQNLLDAFAEFCGDDLAVAHNAVFDFQFLSSDIRKYESRAPRGLILDTYPMAKKVFPGLANYKLGTIIQHLQIPSGQFHRAEEDASYCGQIFIKILEKIGSSESFPPLENMVALTGRPELRFPQIEPQPKQLNLLDQFL